MMLDDVSISPQISEQYISSPSTTLTSLSRILPLDEVNPFFLAFSYPMFFLFLLGSAIEVGRS